MLALARDGPVAEAAGRRAAPAVVAIGASAGGLEALQSLLPHLRPNGVTAYVVAQHMASDSHHDLLCQLLQRTCTLPVRLMTGGAPPEPDTVALVPAGCHARLAHSGWELQPPSGQFVYTPSVDALLLSLADGLGGRAASVVLSGAGSDGAIGAAALVRSGGSVWVQAPLQARFDGMPRAVIAAVPEARVLEAEHMPAAWGWSGPTPGAKPAAPGADLAALLARVRLVTGIDFSGYKPDTLERRTARRLGELGLPDLAAYLSRMDGDPQEAWTLQRRFLVSVSSFFRDRAAFEALGRAWRLQPPDPGRGWRCWVPACATGEEAYTLAMMFAEGRSEGAWSGTAEVLGTDLNDEALAHAWRARYGAKALREVDGPSRERFFASVGADFEVAPALRPGVRFERQDVLTVQPDGPWDVISCRNLLIYLQTPLQERLIAAFHARLSPGGWLFISPSETLPQACLRGFAPHDMTHRIYRRLP